MPKRTALVECCSLAALMGNLRKSVETPSGTLANRSDGAFLRYEIICLMSQFNPPTQPVASPSAPKTKKPIYKRKWVIALAALILFYWVAPKEDSSNSTSNSKSSTSSTSSSSTIPAIDWTENLRPEVLPNEMVMTTCKELAKVISAQSKIVTSRISSTEKPSSDPYDSSEYLQTIEWEDTRHSLVILDEKKAITNPILVAGSLSIPTDSQYKGFLAESVTACGLETVSSDLDKSANRLDSRLISMQSSANNLPWYPKGFNEYTGDSQIAWRWAERGEYRCSYGDYCWGMFITAREGCPSSLYAEITILDSSGTNIGFTNDTTSGLGAGQKAKLVFESFTSGAKTARLAKISCY